MLWVFRPSQWCSRSLSVLRHGAVLPDDCCPTFPGGVLVRPLTVKMSKKIDISVFKDGTAACLETSGGKHWLKTCRVPGYN
jgi:hypothetical protein